MIRVTSELIWCTRSGIGVESEYEMCRIRIKCENKLVPVCGGCTNLSADGESGAHKVETVEDTAEMEIHSEEDEASRGTSPLSKAVSTQRLRPPTASTPQSPAQMMHEELAPATAVESTPNTLLASDALAPEDIIVHT